MTTLPRSFLLGAAVILAVAINSTSYSRSTKTPSAASEAASSAERRVPVRTLVYRTNASAPNGITAEQVRWGRRFGARYGPPYRGYYFSGPVRYPTYYPGSRYYRAYRPQYPGYYGRGYYGNPWGGVRVGRYGAYWR